MYYSQCTLYSSAPCTMYSVHCTVVHHVHSVHNTVVHQVLWTVYIVQRCLDRVNNVAHYIHGTQCTTHFTLQTAPYIIHTLHTNPHCTLHPTHYVHGTLCTTHFTLHTAPYTLHTWNTTHYTLNIAHCPVHTKHCKQHTYTGPHFFVIQSHRGVYSSPKIKYHQPELGPLIGAYYNGPKFKCQPTSGTGWFSYKIWAKNSKTPIGNLLKNLTPFRNYIFKIHWEIHFFTFLNIDWNAQKKIRI